MESLRFRATLLAAAALLALAPASSAQTMEGDQVLSWGIGVRSQVRMNVIRDSDVGDPSIPPFSADALEKPGTIQSLQYFYQAAPRWAFGVIAEFNEYTGDTLSIVQPLNTPPASYASITTRTRMRDYEVVPAAKYFFMDRQRVNPYLLGGLGINYLDSSTSWSKAYPVVGVMPANYDSRLYRKSAGVAAILGGGVQATLTNWLLAGVEGRYEILQTSSSSFGRSLWNSISGYLWIGTKWNAPF